MKKFKKEILLVSILIFILGLGYVSKTDKIDLNSNSGLGDMKAYIQGPSNILDNVFEQDGLTILPYIFTSSGQTLRRTTVEEHFNNANITITNITGTKIVNGIEVVATGTQIITEGRTYTVLIYGDVDGDGEVDTFDAQRVLNHFLGTIPALTGVYKLAANVYNDDDTIDTFDAQRILMFYIGLQSRLVLNEPAHILRIEITAPTKVIYNYGEELNLAGGTVRTIMSSGTSPAAIPITSTMISGYDKNTVGAQTVTVTYLRKTATFTVTVQEPTDPTKVVSIEVIGLVDGELSADNENPLDKSIMFYNYLGKGEGKIDVEISRIVKKTVPTGVDIVFLNVAGLDVSNALTLDKVVTQISLTTTITTAQDITIVLTIDGTDFEIKTKTDEPTKIENISIAGEVIIYDDIPANNTDQYLIKTGGKTYTLLAIELETNKTGETVKLKANQIVALIGGEVAGIDKLSYKDDVEPAGDGYMPSVQIRGFRWEGTEIVEATGTEEIDFIGIADVSWDFEDLEDGTITLIYKTTEKTITVTIEILLEYVNSRAQVPTRVGVMA